METFFSPYLILFALSFLAATLIPLGSEPYLIALSLKGEHPLLVLWLVATLGNTLGSMVTYWLGTYGKTKWMGLKEKHKIKYTPWIEKYGPFVGLLAWLPLIGDILALLMGLLKTPKRVSFLCFLIGKGIRYGLVIGFF